MYVFCDDIKPFSQTFSMEIKLRGKRYPWSKSLCWTNNTMLAKASFYIILYAVKTHEFLIIWKFHLTNEQIFVECFYSFDCYGYGNTDFLEAWIMRSTEGLREILIPISRNRPTSNIVFTFYSNSYRICVMHRTSNTTDFSYYLIFSFFL